MSNQRIYKRLFKEEIINPHFADFSIGQEIAWNVRGERKNRGIVIGMNQSESKLVVEDHVGEVVEVDPIDVYFEKRNRRLKP